jgi:hypothetical protein
MSRSKRVFKLVAAKRPELVLCQDRLVVAPMGDILRGFMLETTSAKDMVYLWSVAMPLYRPSNGEYLEHSERIAYIHLDRKDYQASAEAVDSIIAPHIPVLRKIADAQDFLKRITLKTGHGSTNFNFDMALSCLRIGDVDQAISILKKLPIEIDQFYQTYQSSMPELKMTPSPYSDFLKKTALRIISDPIGSPALLDKWVDENVEALGLQSVR